MEHQNPKSEFEMSPGTLKELQIRCVRRSLSFKHSHNNWVACHDSPAVPPWLRGGLCTVGNVILQWAQYMENKDINK